uniref:Secreted protein n=1 Tax=Anguilla anguilla TaxID=7936 RepID=A0A0E9WEY1_ANGAN
MWGTTQKWAPSATWLPRFWTTLSRWTALSPTRGWTSGPSGWCCGRSPGGPLAMELWRTTSPPSMTWCPVTPALRT